MLSIEFELNAYNYVMLCESPPSNEGVIPFRGSLLTPPRSSHCCWLKLMIFLQSVAFSLNGAQNGNLKHGHQLPLPYFFIRLLSESRRLSI